MDPELLSAGLGAVGSLFGGIMGMSAGDAQRKAEQAAAAQRLRESGVDAGLALGQGEATAAKAATQAAANGGGIGGSSALVIQNLSQQAMFDARSAVYSGVTEANNDLYQGEVAAANGRNALIKGVIGAGSSLASGWMQDSAARTWRTVGGRPRSYGTT